jgi:hypothetical protein
MRDVIVDIKLITFVMQLTVFFRSYRSCFINLSYTTNYITDCLNNSYDCCSLLDYTITTTNDYYSNLINSNHISNAPNYSFDCNFHHSFNIMYYSPQLVLYIRLIHFFLNYIGFDNNLNFHTTTITKILTKFLIVNITDSATDLTEILIKFLKLSTTMK